MVASILKAGDIALVSYATDDTAGSEDDILRFVVLAPIGSGTQIFFTDRTWTPTPGSSFQNAGSFAAAGGGEGTYTLNVGSDLAVGDVITITTAQLTAAGINLSDATGEAVYVYQGTDANTPTQFVHAAEIADGNNVFGASLVNTGLTPGLHTLAYQFDQASFGGHATGSPQHQLAEIADTVANWHGSDANDNGGTIYDDRADVTISGPLSAPDMQVFAVMAGGGQSDAIVRMDNDEAANLATNLTRLMRDNPNFTRLEDISFDLEDGVWFAADNEGTDVTRILKGNIADLLNPGTAPTITVLFDYPNNAADSLDDKFIQGIEIDKTANRIFFTLGEIVAGHEFRSIDYNGANARNWGLIDEVIDPTFGFAGGIEDFVVDPLHNTAYFTYVLVNAPAGQVLQNYIVKLNGVTGLSGNPNSALDHYDIVNIANAGAPPAGYDPGRLPDAEGSLKGVDIDAANNILWFTTGRLGVNGTGGVFKLDLATLNYTEIWQQPSNAAHNTPQAFPTTIITDIEVDTIGGRYYLSSLNNTDTPVGHDGTATDENGSRIWSGSLASAPGTAPIFFASVFENTANGGPGGMEINYSPTTTALVGAGATYTESNNALNSPAGPALQVAGAPTLADQDTTALRGAVVSIAGFVAGDVLGFTNSGGVTGSYNAATGVLTFSGSATFAQYATVLDTVTFTNAGDNPTDYGTRTSRTLYFQAFDGLSYGDPATVAVSVVGINDAPVNSGMGGTFSGGGLVEDAVVGVALTGISVLDVDANPGTQDLKFTFTVSHGTLTLLTNVAGGIIGGDITGGVNGSATVTVTATQNQMNTTLDAANGLTYIPTANFNGNDTLNLTSDDQGLNGNDPGSSGTGTSEADVDNKTIFVSAVNDAPVRTGDGTEVVAAILEDTPLTDAAAPTVATLFTGQFSDATDDQSAFGGSSPNTLAGVAVVGNGSSGATGQWQYWTGAVWTDIGAASAASAQLITAATKIRFNPVLNYNGNAPTLTVHLVDSSGAAFANGDDVNLSGVGATGGTTRYSVLTVALDQAITAVNDAPVNTVGGSLDILEDAPAANVTGVSITDVEANPASDLVSVTLDVDHGTLAILTNVAGGIVAGDIVSQDADTISILATINKINTTLAAAGGLTYDSDANYFGGDTLEVTTSDLGNTGQDPVPGTGTGSDEQDVDSKTINIAAVDDPATTAADADDVNEDATVNIAVLANDSDIDTTLAVAEVDGQAISPGGTVTLASGAEVTLELDGTLTYDPNDQFNHLITAALATATGAVNDTATETFSYELAGGETANVTVTVHGVASPEDVLMGDATDNTINGTGGTDFFYVMQPGTETLDGMGGNDAFLFGPYLDATDDVDGGAGTKDQLGIQGDYSGGLTLGANNLNGIETFVLMSGTDTRFGDPGTNLYDYDITTVDENVPNGGLLKVNFNTLVAGEDVHFDGSAEMNGAFFFYAGQGQDTLIGGAGDDAFYFGHDGSAPAFTAADSVDGGGGNNDQLGLRGDYANLITFGSTTMQNVEVLVAISSTDARFGNTGSNFHYNLKTHNDNVDATKTLSVTGAMLTATEGLTFDGSAEMDGQFDIKGGKGTDVLTGGALGDLLFGNEGQDNLTGGGGNDMFRYRSAADSAVGDEDQILDFTAGDKIDLAMMDANSTAPGNNAFTFSNDGTFHGIAGELRAYESSPGTWFVEGDLDAGGTADFAIQVTLTNPLAPLVVGDFNL